MYANKMALASSSILQSLVNGVILVFAGFLAFIFTQSLFMLFFVPIIGYSIWSARDKSKELERRLSKLERPSEPKPEQK